MNSKMLDVGLLFTILYKLGKTKITFNKIPYPNNLTYPDLT
jgi:hypothetical protein